MPFGNLLGEDGKMLPPAQLQAAFQAAGVETAGASRLLTSCGSGVTASVISLALAQLGREGVPLYDGSWAEWGTADDTPVETGPTAA